ALSGRARSDVLRQPLEPRPGGCMLAMVVAFAIAAIVLPPIVRRLGPKGFLVGALVPLAAFVFAAIQGPIVTSGGVVSETVPWIPELGFALAMRMDTLSWVLALIVAGVGTVVMLYCASYFSRDEHALGRFAGVFLAFAGAMYGLVLADDVYLL